MYRQCSIIGILAATLTYGCATVSFTPVMLPNGAAGGVLDCRLKAECFHTASHLCHGAYIVVQADDNPANDFHSSPGGTVEYVIQCSNPTKSEVSDGTPQE